MEERVRKTRTRRGEKIMGIILFSIGMPLIILVSIVSMKIGYDYRKSQEDANVSLNDGIQKQDAILGNSVISEEIEL